MGSSQVDPGDQSRGENCRGLRRLRQVQPLGEDTRGRRRASSLHAHVVACALDQVLADGATGHRASASVVPLLELMKKFGDLRTGCLGGAPRLSRDDGHSRQDRPRGQEPARAPGRSRLGHEARAGGSGTRSSDFAGRAVDDVGARHLKLMGESGHKQLLRGSQLDLATRA